MKADLSRVVRKWRRAYSRRRKTQHIPDHTCPLINSVIRETGEDCSCRDIVEPLMESIRDANYELRNLGKDWYRFAGLMLDELETVLKETK